MKCGACAYYEREIERLERERDAGAKFKAWVHGWLDSVGVPHDPEPEHTAEHGCRISGRMRWLRRERDEAVAAWEEDLSNLLLAVEEETRARVAEDQRLASGGARRYTPLSEETKAERLRQRLLDRIRARAAQPAAKHVCGQPATIRSGRKWYCPVHGECHPDEILLAAQPARKEGT